LLPHIDSQGIEVDLLEGSIDPVVTILAGSSRGSTDMNPVGRLVTGAPESVLLHESFQQLKAMAVTPLPISIDAVGNLSQDMAG
jgi:hypothetical protein